MSTRAGCLRTGKASAADGRHEPSGRLPFRCGKPDFMTLVGATLFLSLASALSLLYPSGLHCSPMAAMEYMAGGCVALWQVVSLIENHCSLRGQHLSRRPVAPESMESVCFDSSDDKAVAVLRNEACFGRGTMRPGDGLWLPSDHLI